LTEGLTGQSLAGYGEAAVGSTITIKGKGSIPISDLRRVSGRRWKIVYEKSYSSGFIPEGF
jgi:hypothetical protein